MRTRKARACVPQPDGHADRNRCLSSEEKKRHFSWGADQLKACRSLSTPAKGSCPGVEVVLERGKPFSTLSYSFAWQVIVISRIQLSQWAQRLHFHKFKTRTVHYRESCYPHVVSRFVHSHTKIRLSTSAIFTSTSIRTICLNRSCLRKRIWCILLHLQLEKKC